MSERKEKYWGKFAHTLDEDQKYIVGEAVQQALVRKLSEERDLGEVIELGCGRGYYIRALAKNAKHVFATDLLDEMLEVARTQLKEFQNITIQKADCENTSFPSGRFDTAVMVNVIHVIENPHKCLEESYRILRSGGLLLLVSYTGHSMKWFERIKMAIRFLRKWGKPLRYFKSNLSPDQLNPLVENVVGFGVRFGVTDLGSGLEI